MANESRCKRVRHCFTSLKKICMCSCLSRKPNRNNQSDVIVDHWDQDNIICLPVANQWTQNLFSAERQTSAPTSINISHPPPIVTDGERARKRRSSPGRLDGITLEEIRKQLLNTVNDTNKEEIILTNNAHLPETPQLPV